MKERRAQLPQAVGWASRRARELAEALAGRRKRPSADGPVPPRRLRARTGAPGLREFVEGGRAAAAELADAAQSAGRPVEQAGAVLDFGCGSGRVLPQLAAKTSASCVGCDVDGAAVEWAARHRPECEWRVSAFSPPLPFAAQAFDLLYSISVFSHLDEALQHRWLAELTRVLAPGGVALLSVHGPGAFEEFRSGRVRTRWCPPQTFRRGALGPAEFLFAPYLRSRWNSGELPGVRSGYGLAFHGADYVRERWSQHLRILDVRERRIAGWQDLVIAVKSG